MTLKGPNVGWADTISYIADISTLASWIFIISLVLQLKLKQEDGVDVVIPMNKDRLKDSLILLYILVLIYVE